ncbi:HEAT repeat-containing protein 1 [Homalodisca vitripennis]|nr:HEAT repeat-containing protein 1 [Homalodisca vitripennis]
MAGTSLAEQLKKLAVPQTSILVHSKKRTSLLYNPRDAADIDRATFYKIGLSGLEELKSIYARLAEFEKSLFDETSLHLERAVEDQQANAKLDQLINRFLILLSPYLNLDPAHKALEWLICRFHIHQYNIDSIMALIMPYHDTNIFARMIQILPLEGRGGKWIWLQPLKKEGIPMSKIFLLSRASSDTSFFKFICNLPLQGVQVHGEESVRLTTLFAFYCTTVIGALHQSPHVSEVQVTHLLPSLIAGLSSCHLDFAASAFMILGYLVTKIHLTPRIFSELFYKVCKYNARECDS